MKKVSKQFCSMFLMMFFSVTQLQAMSLQDFKASKIYRSPVGHSQIMMKDFLNLSDAPDSVKEAAVNFFLSVEGLNQRLQVFQLNPQTHEGKDEFEKQIEETRKNYVALINELIGKPKASALFEDFSKAVIDPNPSSEKNKVLYALFSKEYSKVPQGTKRLAIDFLNRHPLTAFINCTLGAMACVMAASGNLRPDELPHLLGADAIFSVGTLFLETNLGSAADRKEAELSSMETHSLLAKNRIESISRNAALNLSTSPHRNKEEALKNQVDQGEQMLSKLRFEIDQINKNIKNRIEALSVSPHADLTKLQGEIKKTNEELAKLDLLKAKIEQQSAPYRRISTYYEPRRKHDF